VVVIHDPTTGRTCDRDLRVAEADFEDLRRLDAGARKGLPWTGQRLPSLREALELMPPDGRLYVEAKSGPAIVEPLLADIAAAGCGGGQVALISFGIDTIRALKRAWPALPCYWVLGFEETARGRWRAMWEESAGSEGEPRAVLQEPVDYAALAQMVRGQGCTLDGLDVSACQPEDFAAAMAAAGIPWGAWTVDDGATALALVRKGAIQLTSNCPADLTAALAHAGS
jgi:glycerophosphoryl diester phosphodiesterase